MHPNVIVAIFTIAKKGSNLNVHWRRIGKEDILLIYSGVLPSHLKK